MRTEPGEIDLGKLAELDALQSAVLERRLTAAQGLDRINELLDKKARYGPVARVLASSLASAAASVFLGGGSVEAILAAVVGAVVAAVGISFAPGIRAARLFESGAACLAWLLAAVLARLLGPFNQADVALAGIVALLPGLMLTLAMSELATSHLASGSARLVGALTVFVSLGIGVVMGSRLALLIIGTTPSTPPAATPVWATYAAVPLAAIAFAVIFRARPREIIPIMLAGGLAIGAARVGARWLDPDLGSFIGAFTAATVSNVIARIRNQPAVLTLVPGIVLLVPGSIGFSSLSSMLNRDVVPGVEAAFRTMLIAVALATGLLIADVLVPSRKR